VAKRDKPFHNPFASLKPVVSAAKPARPKAQVPPEEHDESVLFREAVGEVLPVRGKGRVAPPPPKVDLTRVPNGDAEALAELNALVETDGPIELSDSDEYIEGAIPSFDRKTLRKLRAGDFAVQAHVDLHGCTREEAKNLLFRFLEESRRDGKRLVLVVHGRGLHSKDQVPVLKESLRAWLSQGRIGRQVLAYATARPHDGGAGAVYLLLRR
jgi:DNA-nicking Smr family endonuclease